MGASSADDPYRISYRHLAGRGFENVNGKVQVSPALAPGENTAVIITLGQSQAGNWLGGTYTPTNAKVENFNIFDGGVYQARQPLLGCDWPGTTLSPHSNFALELGDLLIDGEEYDRVIFAPMALAMSLFSVWRLDAAERIPVMARRLAAAGLVPTHILYSGGESDAGVETAQAACESDLEAVLAAFRSNGIAAPMWVARQTWFGGSQPAGATAVRAAQAAIVDNVDIFAGPDLDTLDNSYRDDGTHFNAAGRAAVAALWYAAITA